MMAERIIAGLGALAGLAGVASTAMAAHGADPGNFLTVSRFLLMHAPALLTLAVLLQAGIVHRRTGILAAAALAGGLVLFSGDLSIRTLYGVAPLRLAAPVGGLMIILGWGLIALGTVLPRR